jgi:hypothetical protein
MVSSVWRWFPLSWFLTARPFASPLLHSWFSSASRRQKRYCPPASSSSLLVRIVESTRSSRHKRSGWAIAKRSVQVPAAPPLHNEHQHQHHALPRPQIQATRGWLERAIQRRFRGFDKFHGYALHHRADVQTNFCAYVVVGIGTDGESYQAHAREKILLIRLISLNFFPFFAPH